MAENTSHTGAKLLQTDGIFIIHSLVMIFLSINFLLILTFFRTDSFKTTARYILFAITLLSDSLLLILSDILFIIGFLQFTLQIWLCVVIHSMLLLYIIVTPVTLTVMTLERYVAICLPLRHGELSSSSGTTRWILIIHGISMVPCTISLLILLPFLSGSVCFQHRICSIRVITLYPWQGAVRSAVYQVYFLSMCIIIIMSYVRILKAARAASGKDKKSIWTGLRTVIIHAFQLLLCLIQLWVPLIEGSLPKNDTFLKVRLINYLLFSVAPRCLSPLVYGLRDKAFLRELKNCFWRSKSRY